MIHETPRDRSWSRPEVLAMSHETPRPQGSRLGSDELFVARSDPDPNSTRPSPKRTLWRPVDQPALRSLTLRSFIFNANEMNTFAHAMMKNVQIQNTDSKLDVFDSPKARQDPAAEGGGSHDDQDEGVSERDCQSL